MKSFTALLTFLFVFALSSPVEAQTLHHSCQIRHPAYYFKMGGSRFHGKYGPRHFRKYHVQTVRHLTRVRTAPRARVRHSHAFAFPEPPRIPYYPVGPGFRRKPVPRVHFSIHVAF